MNTYSVSTKAAIITWTVILLVPFTYSAYLDRAQVLANNFMATSIDIELQTTEGAEFDGPLFLVTEMMPNESEVRTVRVVNAGVLTPQYKAEVAVTGAAELCGEADMTAQRDGVMVFSGRIDDFDAPPSLISDGADDWQVEVVLLDDAEHLQNIGCEFSWTFTAWPPEAQLVEFGDTEELAASLTTGSWIETMPMDLMGLMENGSDVLNEFVVPLDALSGLGDDDIPEGTDPEEDSESDEDDTDDEEPSPTPENTETPEPTPETADPQESDEDGTGEEATDEGSGEDEGREGAGEETSNPELPPEV